MMNCIDCKQKEAQERNGDNYGHVRVGTWLIGKLYLCDTCYVSLIATGYKRQERPLLMTIYSEQPQHATTGEAIYDEQIQPLMEQIAKIAEMHHIPFVAVFQRNEDFMQTFSHLPDGTISELHEAGYAIGVYRYE